LSEPPGCSNLLAVPALFREPATFGRQGPLQVPLAACHLTAAVEVEATEATEAAEEAAAGRLDPRQQARNAPFLTTPR